MGDKVTWGDTVRINDNAPSEFRPGTRGAVTGLRENERLDGTRETLVLVEFSDGNAIEIPESFLVRDDCN